MTLHLHGVMAPFDPVKPAQTRDGRYPAQFDSRRRGPNGGYIFTLTGYKDDAGADRKCAYRDDGRWFRVGAPDDPHPMDLVNVETFQ